MKISADILSDYVAGRLEPEIAQRIDEAAAHDLELTTRISAARMATRRVRSRLAMDGAVAASVIELAGFTA